MLPAALGATNTGGVGCRGPCSNGAVPCSADWPVITSANEYGKGLFDGGVTEAVEVGGGGIAASGDVNDFQDGSGASCSGDGGALRSGLRRRFMSPRFSAGEEAG